LILHLPFGSGYAGLGVVRLPVEQGSQSVIRKWMPLAAKISSVKTIRGCQNQRLNHAKESLDESRVVLRLNTIQNPFSSGYVGILFLAYTFFVAYV